MDTNIRRMRFQWSLPSTGVSDRLRGAQERTDINPIGDLGRQRDFCRRADELGLDSVLLPIGFQRADPTVIAATFGLATERVKYMIAARPTIISPTHFVQQVNTVSAFINGRIEVNVVSGSSSEELKYYGDHLGHDERYRYTDEFWTICHALWRRDFPYSFAGEHLTINGARINQTFVSPDRDRPYVYIGGSSELARGLAIKHADCLMRLVEPPEELAPKIEPVLAAGVEVGVIGNLLARPTYEEAVSHAHSLIAEAGDVGRTAVTNWRRHTAESVGFTSVYQMAEQRSAWLTPFLWTGLVPYFGAVSISLIGGVDEIVDAIFEYRRIGVTQFLFQGRPDLPTLELFGTMILPRIREREAAESAPTPGDPRPPATARPVAAMSAGQDSD